MRACTPLPPSHLFAECGSSSTEGGSHGRRQTQPPDRMDRWRATSLSQHWSGQAKRYSKEKHTFQRSVGVYLWNMYYAELLRIFVPSRPQVGSYFNISQLIHCWSHPFLHNRCTTCNTLWQYELSTQSSVYTNWLFIQQSGFSVAYC